MVDTGSAFFILNEDKYGFLRHGADRKLPPGVPATVEVNDLKAPVVMAHNFRLGDNDLGGWLAALVPGEELHDDQVFHYRGRANQYDGLLGQNFLRQYRAVIDCSRQLLYLSLGTPVPQTLATVLPAHGWTRVPMSDAGDALSVPCALNGHPYRIIIDTGSPYTFLDQVLLNEAQVRETDLPMNGGVIGNQARRLGLVSLDRLQIGDYTATNVQMTSTANLRHALPPGDEGHGSEPTVGLLGSDVLAFNGAIIDVGGRALYLKHVSPGERKP